MKSYQVIFAGFIKRIMRNGYMKAPGSHAWTFSNKRNENCEK